MTPLAHRRSILRLAMAGLVLAGLASVAHGQVFTVGEKTATADINTDFKPTHVESPDAGLTERGRRELVRDLEAEQGFAHRVLPLGATLTLQANGNLTPRDDQYKQVVYKKGQSAGPGDRIVVTGLEFKGDRIVIDLNGGPYPPHRFMRHIQIGVGMGETAPPNLDERATGCRINLVFEGGVPELSAPEVKALLQPVVDFTVKTGELAYADTLPAPLKSAIASHEVLVGMNRRMVLAALGQPESKVREGSGDERYEEWIYGHQPQTMHFVRFVGDRVTMVKTAALGKPIDVQTDDAMGGYLPPPSTVAVGDVPKPEGKEMPPTLKLPNEDKVPTETENPDTGYRKVQMPTPKTTPAATPGEETSEPAPASGSTAPAPSAPAGSTPSPSAPPPSGPPSLGPGAPAVPPPLM